MGQLLRMSGLVPRGFIVETTTWNEERLLIAARASAATGRCPDCGMISDRVHSRYERGLADLPMSGRLVRLVLTVRRFRCGAVTCARQIFAERFDPDVLAPWARRTARLDHIIHHLALALGGRPAASFARRLMLPVSNDTLLRVVRRRGIRGFAPPTVVGLTIGRGAATSATGRSFAIWSGDARSPCCPIGNLRPRRLGSSNRRRSRSSPGIAAAATLWPPPRRCRRQRRSLIDGI